MYNLTRCGRGVELSALVSGGGGRLAGSQRSKSRIDHKSLRSRELVGVVWACLEGQLCMKSNGAEERDGTWGLKEHELKNLSPLFTT